MSLCVQLIGVLQGPEGPKAFFLKGDGPDMKAHCANGPYAMAEPSAPTPRRLHRPPLPGADLARAVPSHPGLEPKDDMTKIVKNPYESLPPLSPF